MTDSATPTRQQAGDGRWLDAEVDGRSVRFWLAVAVVIAVVVLGIGVWWVWGLDRDMASMEGMDGMGDMPHTDVRLPPVAGLYEGEEVFFVHPEASDAEVAETLTDMMGGSPVLIVEELAEVPEAARDEVYVFANGIEGHGPFGHQRDVFPSAPGDPDYSPLRTVVLVTWHDEEQARELTAAEEVTAAADAGEVDLEEIDTVVNMPFLTWPEGER